MNYGCEGKRLLVLGGTDATCDLVRAARKMGIYTVVTDYLPSGPAKQLADETALVSTADIEALAALVKEKNIDGVFTGASEFNIQNVIALSERAGLPCYCAKEQWDVCSNKKKFKQLCREHGVPVIREYAVSPALTAEELACIKYPVIVKPVDGNSSRGISVCRDEAELKNAYRAALEGSASGQVIVEQFVQGDNVEVYYLAQDGEIMLCAISDRITVDQPGKAPLPVAFCHPSRYLDRYLAETDGKVREMFQKFGIKNGMFFMESFATEEGFFFYEMGYRVNGTMEYHFVDHFNGFDPFCMMISYAVRGKMADRPVLEYNRPDFNGGVGCELSILLRAGEIGSVKGEAAVRALPQVIHWLAFHKPGDTVDQIGTFDQIFARVHLAAPDEQQLKAAVEQVWQELDVLDKDGKSMLFCPYHYN